MTVICIARWKEVGSKEMWGRQSNSRMLREILENTRRIMAGVDDLNKAVADVATAITAETAVVTQVVTALKAGGLTDAQAEALAQALEGSVTNINTQTAALQAALPPTT